MGPATVPPMTDASSELIEVGDGIAGWLAPSRGFGSANSAAVIEDDGITIVDTGTVPSHAGPFADTLAQLGVPIRRLVLTSSHIDYVGGSTAYPLAAVYGSPETSAHLDQPPNVEAYASLAPELTEEFAILATRAVTHAVRDAAWISSRVVVAPTGGQIGENLVVQIPDANVVLAGAMASFGVIPAAFGGDPARWADELDVLLGWGTTILPGHGPVGGEPEVRALQSYLRACVAADGDPEAIPEGAWSEWADQRFHISNVERAAMLAAGDPSPPPSVLALMGLA
jgi:cyclase